MQGKTMKDILYDLLRLKDQIVSGETQILIYIELDRIIKKLSDIIDEEELKQ